jgi:hypothetical protein
MASTSARSWPRGVPQGSTVVKSDQSGKSRSIVRQCARQPGCPLMRMALGATRTMPCSVCLSQILTMSPPLPPLPWNAKITGNSWLAGLAGTWMQ